MSSTKVSIGLPVYNDEKTVEFAIKSILNQTHTNIELIISDNCSSDATQEICLLLANTDKRIKYFRQKTNIGMIPNFNFVLKNSTSEYFMWLGGDDRFEETYIQECLKVFFENDDCVSVFCHFVISDTNTGKIISRITPSSTSSDFVFPRLMLRIKEPIPNILFGLHRRSVLNKIDQFESFDWFDILACIEIVYFGKIYIIPKYLYHCGIDKIRKPYSLSGDYFNMNLFNIKLRKFLKNKLSFIRYFYYILYCKYFSYISQKRLNKIIDQWGH